MKNYWSAIYYAWKKSIATEHEYFSIPAIYKPQLVARLETQLKVAEVAAKPLQARKNLLRNEQLVLERLKFTRLSLGVIQSYTQMQRAVRTRTAPKPPKSAHRAWHCATSWAQ